MNRRRTFLILFVVLVLILVGGLALLLLQRGPAKEPQPEPVGVVELGETPIPMERVVVALQTIPRGMRIPPDAVEIREWPIEDEDFPDDPIYDLNKVVGMVARVEISMHRPVSASSVKLVYIGEGSEMALAIPKGKVAIAIPAMAVSAVANAIRPSDRIDVLISLSIVEVNEDSQIKLPVPMECPEGAEFLDGCWEIGDQIPRLVTQYTVQNALVMGVGIWEEERPDVEAVSPEEAAEEEEPVIPVAEEEEALPPPEATMVEAATKLAVVTLAVSPQDALVLKWAWESNASIDLVMRSAIDNDIYAQPEAVTLQYMIDRFQISLPPKLPHTPENKFEYRLIKEAEERARPAEE